MTLRILTFALLLGLGLASCKNDSGSASTEETPAVPMEGMEGMAPPPADGGTATPVSNPNPPHGEPGHRCDIPVGASLDAPMAPGYTPPSGAATPIQTIPQSSGSSDSPLFSKPASSTQPAAPASVTGVKNPNPPHGEPGHRCEIPVGASLDGQ